MSRLMGNVTAVLTGVFLVAATVGGLPTTAVSAPTDPGGARVQSDSTAAINIDPVANESYAWDGGKELAVNLTLTNSADGYDSGNDGLPVVVRWPSFLRSPTVNGCQWKVLGLTSGTCVFYNIGTPTNAQSADIVFPAPSSGSGTGVISFMETVPTCTEPQAKVFRRSALTQSNDLCGFDSTWLRSNSRSFTLLSVGFSVFPAIAKPGQVIRVIPHGVPDGAEVSITSSGGDLEPSSLRFPTLAGQKFWLVVIPRRDATGWMNITMHMVSWKLTPAQTKVFRVAVPFPDQTVDHSLLIVPDQGQPSRLVWR